MICLMVFYKRFFIAPISIIIPKINPNLANNIIYNELPEIMNRGDYRTRKTCHKWSFYRVFNYDTGTGRI